MKKWLFLVSLIAAVFISGCGKKVSSTSHFSTVLDQSELRWYISQNYDVDVSATYSFYDILPGGETSILVAKTKAIESDTDYPAYFVQCVYEGMGSWYLYREEPLLTIYEFDDPKEDDNGVKKLNLNDGFSLFIKESKDDIEKIAFGDNSGDRLNVAMNYSYDKSGNLSTGKILDYISYDNFFMTDNMDARTNATYSYNSDGSLAELSIVDHIVGEAAAPSDKSSGNIDEYKTAFHYSFLYNNEGLRIEDNAENEKMEYRCNDEGYTEYVKYQDLNNYTGFYPEFFLNYKNGGTVEIITNVGLSLDEVNRLRAQGYDFETPNQNWDSNTTSHQVEFEENAYPDVNALVTSYLEAMSIGDTATMASLSSYQSDDLKAFYKAQAEYEGNYSNINVYTMKRPVEDSFFVATTYDFMIKGQTTPLPTLISFYVYRDDSGSLYIKSEDLSDDEKAYARELSTINEFASLLNQIDTNYNMALESDSNLAAAVSTLNSEIEQEKQRILNEE